MLWGNRSRQPFRLDRFSNAKYEIDLEYEFQSRIRVIAISEKLFGSNNQQIVLSRSRLLLFPATPEGDERSKDTQSINMFGGNDLVEGERMSGQDVRTNNGAPPFPLRRSVRSKQRPVPVDAWRFGGRLRDRPIAASTLGFCPSRTAWAPGGTRAILPNPTHSPSLHRTNASPRSDADR